MNLSGVFSKCVRLRGKVTCLCKYRSDRGTRSDIAAIPGNAYQPYVGEACTL
jgi:hypothetical protein